MNTPRLISLAAALALAVGCSRQAVPLAPAHPPAAAAPASFEDRVWRVARSSAVAEGTLYEFRSDGTLVITSPGSKPLLGSWSRSGDGLVMVEESRPYQVDILALDGDEFAIRSHNPGEPVDIVMVPAAPGSAAP